MLNIFATILTGFSRSLLQRYLYFRDWGCSVHTRVCVGTRRSLPSLAWVLAAHLKNIGLQFVVIFCTYLLYLSNIFLYLLINNFWTGQQNTDFLMEVLLKYLDTFVEKVGAYQTVQSTLYERPYRGPDAGRTPRQHGRLTRSARSLAVRGAQILQDLLVDRRSNSSAVSKSRYSFPIELFALRRMH